MATGRLGAPLTDPVCLQPSSSCSFDGSLKLDQSDSESKWPEIPPVLNQNEDRKKNKYLRKDYLKVQAGARVPPGETQNACSPETLVAQVVKVVLRKDG